MKNNLRALIEFSKLQNREIHPEGTFDKAGRFYLSNCPGWIREPSRAHPFSQMAHGRTLEYVVREADLDEDEVKELKKYVDRVSKAVEGAIFSKLVESKRLVVLTEINKQLKKSSSDYKKWSQSFTNEELVELKKEVLNQIEKAKPKAA